jgi:hypothetical protein
MMMIIVVAVIIFIFLVEDCIYREISLAILLMHIRLHRSPLEVNEYRILPLLKNKNYRKIDYKKKEHRWVYMAEGKRINNNNKKSYG